MNKELLYVIFRATLIQKKRKTFFFISSARLFHILLDAFDWSKPIVHIVRGRIKNLHRIIILSQNKKSLSLKMKFICEK